MKQDRIKKLHLLAKTKNDRAFSPEEHAEYEELKKEYVESIKDNLHSQLKNAGVPKKTKE
ncbi:DUF896 domain-containing protein [Clostridium sp. 'deep sea']|uniref:DUF896 domain-containing protein n=1 Tax=Clostridium sp. 'deep sea' TaxID=2779445 RepID=UPI0018964C3E|nr:DUF896 domain-containing protein [Clostridium sp. 'deep sea']QOR36541.1 DUF896 domain-containing protein [Clostridium sp. 'deep sea']